MAQYIDKDALIAEIENLGNTYKKCPTRNSYEEGLKDGRLIGYKDALHKIDTLEVKEVDLQEEPASEDLEEEIRRYMDNAPTRTDLGQRYKDISIVETARHFANWQKQQMMKDAIRGQYIRLRWRE